MLTDWSSTFLVSLPSPNESRFPINVGITSYVATTGEVILIIILFHQDMFTIKPFHLTLADGKYYRRLQRSPFWSICRRRDRFYPQNCALHANQKFRWLHNWRNTGACVKISFAGRRLVSDEFLILLLLLISSVGHFAACQQIQRLTIH